MKDDLHGKHFTSDNTVIMAIKKWLLDADSNFYKRVGSVMDKIYTEWRSVCGKINVST
jgi:hypothetical protein